MINPLIFYGINIILGLLGGYLLYRLDKWFDKTFEYDYNAGKWRKK